MGEEHELVQRFLAARRPADEVVLEGYHAIKHAIRFGGRLGPVVVLEGTPATDLPRELDGSRLLTVPADLFDRLVPSRPPVPVVALAARPPGVPEPVLWSGSGPVVALERPTHLGNLGAVVRVAAAAGAAAVVTVGRHDPWHPSAIRGAAGLQFAVPTGRIERLPATQRPLVGLHPDGEDLERGALPRDALLVFGSERRGLSPDVQARADALVRLPMRSGVSSLNLATAVAITLYAGLPSLPATPGEPPTG